MAENHVNRQKVSHVSMPCLQQVKIVESQPNLQAAISAQYKKALGKWWQIINRYWVIDSDLVVLKCWHCALFLLTSGPWLDTNTISNTIWYSHYIWHKGWQSICSIWIMVFAIVPDILHTTTNHVHLLRPWQWLKEPSTMSHIMFAQQKLFAKYFPLGFPLWNQNSFYTLFCRAICLLFKFSQ